MNKIVKTFVAIVVVLSLIGCYTDYDNPAVNKIYTDADFAASEILTIKEFKDLFYDKYGNGPEGFTKHLNITSDIVIRGKVISSDVAGNVYKSLYIYDAEGESAIELKLMAGNSAYYHVGQTIYVRAKGLAIGNYRWMLSLGNPPSEVDIENGYANSNIENPLKIEQHILPGVYGSLIQSDTLVITKNNYTTALTDASLGRLVRFEGVSSKIGSVANWGYDSSYPSYFKSSDDNFTWAENNFEGGPSWGYYNNIVGDKNYGDRYYGSALFTYGDVTKLLGNYIVRSSGYSRFRDNRIPRDGKMCDITAIYGKFSNGSGWNGSLAYQLTLNSLDDVREY